jgi:hypothetical protein
MATSCEYDGIVLRVAMFAITCLAGCGRIAFDERAPFDAGDGGAPGDGGRDASDGASDDASTGTFGTMDVGVSIQNTSTDRVWISQFMLTEPAMVQQLVVRCAPTGGQGADVRGVIYADASGTPATLLATTNVITVPSGPQSWVPLAFSAPLALEPGMYWLGTHNASAISIAYQSAIGGTKFNNDVFADGTDATYGGGATTFSMQLSIYAEYTR